LRPELLRNAGLPLRAGVCGAALGIVAFASGGLVLRDTAGILPAAAGLACTFVVSLAAGLWAGAPAARRGSPAHRWILAGLSLGVAGVFATLWGAFTDSARNAPVGRAVALLVLVGVPVYCTGLLFTTLAAAAQDHEEAGPEDEDEEETEPGPPPVTGRVLLPALVGFAAGAAAAGLVLLPAVPAGTLLLATGALLTFPLVFPRAREAGEPETRESTLYETETPFGTLRVTEIVYPGQRQPERRLYQNEEIESGEQSRSGNPTFAYVAAAERWLAEVSPAGSSLLFLGGGAYTLPRRMAERDPSARIAVVELDPEVTRVAYRFFGLRGEHGITSWHGDARAVAAAVGEGEWDRIFLDVYDGTEAIPHHLVTREAFETYRRALKPGGLLLVNCIGVAQDEGALRLWSTVRTLAEVFPSRAVYLHLGRDYPERQNFLLAAGGPDVRLPPRAGSFEPWPEEEWPRLEGVAVFRDAQPAAQTGATATGAA
jgi:spermidine synthase